MTRTAKTTPIALLIGLFTSAGLLAQNGYRIRGDNPTPSFAVDAKKEIQLALENQTLVVELLPEFSIDKAAYNVYNIFGNVVLAGRIAEHRFSIELSGLQKGIYILVITNGSEHISRKFVKTR